MTIKKGAWYTLMRGFTCHVLRQHEWKRAVRTQLASLGAPTNGTQTCRRCGATRAVLLRTVKSTRNNVTVERTFAEPAPPPSQWPAQ